MGTSKSYGGPRDTNRLVPSWALSQPDGTGPVPGPVSPPATSSGGQVSPPSPQQDNGNLRPVAPSPAQTPLTTSATDERIPYSIPLCTWRKARLSLNKAIGRSQGKRSFRTAGRRYVRAHGGARSAARSASSGRAATAGLARFMSTVASHGFSAAMATVGLASVVGKNADVVFSAIANALAPTGDTRDQAIARDAVAETLENLYERYALDDGDFSKLDQMTADDVRSVIEDSVSTFIYDRWLEELGTLVEQKAISPTQAAKIERDMRAYVKETVKLDLKDMDVLNVDWNGTLGRDLVQRIYQEAYDMLGSPK